jgi:hypothetical protein
MKRIYLLSIVVLTLGVLITSCVNEDTIRVPKTKDAINLRIQQDPSYTNLRADDLEHAKLVFSLFSINKNIKEVHLTIQYYNFQQDSLYSLRSMRKFSQADFDAANGAIRDVTITAQELATLFNVTLNDIGGGDRYDVFNVTTLTDGRVYPDTISLPDGDVSNITPTFVNSSATTSFSTGFVSYVACPVSTGFATGDYLLEQIAGPGDPFFGNPVRFATEAVNLNAASPIQRNFNVTYLTFDSRPFSFLLICNNFLVNQGASLGCSVGLRWTNAIPPGTYDPNDDSELIIEILENVDGDCDLPAGEPLTLKLTKIN